MYIDTQALLHAYMHADTPMSKDTQTCIHICIHIHTQCTPIHIQAHEHTPQSHTICCYCHPSNRGLVRTLATILRCPVSTLGLLEVSTSQHPCGADTRPADIDPPGPEMPGLGRKVAQNSPSTISVLCSVRYHFQALKASRCSGMWL